MRPFVFILALLLIGGGLYVALSGGEAPDASVPTPAEQTSEQATPKGTQDDASPLPESDIFLADFTVDDAGVLALSNVVNITDRAGYDNQPWFADDGTLYYTREADPGRTDSWSYAPATGEHTAVFTSPGISEYSPQVLPGGEGLSYIQENAARDITEVHIRRWGEAEGRRVAGFRPLGYYAWLQGGESLAVFVRDEPPALALIDRTNAPPTIIARDIARVLKVSPDGQTLYFATRIKDDRFGASSLDVARGVVNRIAALPGTATEYAVLHDGFFATLIAADNGILWIYPSDTPDTPDGWQRIADLKALGISDASRIAIDQTHGKIAIVGRKAP